MYSVFSRLISKVKSVPFSSFLNIIGRHLFKGCRTNDLKFMLILFVSANDIRAPNIPITAPAPKVKESTTDNRKKY
jgi:hypothetical protein